MIIRIVVCLLVAAFLPPNILEAQQSKVYRIGAIHQGGPYKAVVDGLRDGLNQKSGMPRARLKRSRRRRGILNVTRLT